ncbi:TMEM175 family protein [Granulicella cerasi]|uniref:TMEM175 family protein n=1 Tax=Granulicella cerasi TaxID=741063 RepID=A0ABW1Z6W9_9BACT|nr:TMEM175 family protein [Granulicella cerasi]
MSERQLTPNRLEAFTDGVIAIIITIMVLELKVPAREVSNGEALIHTLPMLFIYLLSFVQTGIYWVNHHYMIHEVKRVTHGLLWANLFFLFTLSLIPFGTMWAGERGLTSFSVALYSVCCVLPAVTWNLLSNAICRSGGKHVAGSGRTAKQVLSGCLYLAAIPTAYFSRIAAIACIGAVAVMWLIPPKEIRELSRQPLS